MAQTALIVGAGSGISASFARLLAKEGYAVALAARDPAKLATIAAETGATTHACDAADPASVDRLFEQVDRRFARLDVCLFNASARVRAVADFIAGMTDRFAAREHERLTGRRLLGG